MLAANLGYDLDLLAAAAPALHCVADLARSEVDTHAPPPLQRPAKLARHALRRSLRCEHFWPWVRVLVLAWQRQTARSSVT